MPEELVFPPFCLSISSNLLTAFGILINNSFNQYVLTIWNLYLIKSHFEILEAIFTHSASLFSVFQSLLETEIISVRYRAKILKVYNLKTEDKGQKK